MATQTMTQPPGILPNPADIQIDQNGLREARQRALRAKNHGLAQYLRCELRLLQTSPFQHAIIRVGQDELSLVTGRE